ncbi:MAG: 30S ribosomal protein S8 [Candidatus Omnitrophica bacterium]|nr:30S ribosomal protein S8 [Candidatus Omnitrophota bacterium]
MSQTDPIADLLTCLRNGSRAGKPQVDVPASRLGSAIVECMKQEGFVQNWRLMKETGPQGVLRVYLRYNRDRKPILRQIRRVSKPGLRIYVGRNKVPKVYSGIGIAILTTPKGVMTDAQARQQGLGGEVICQVW